MVIWDNLFTGGATGEVFKSYPVEVIPSGSTGTIKTLTPSTGKRIRIDLLESVGAQTSLTTISCNGNDIVSSVNLSNEGNLLSANRYLIGRGFSSVTGELSQDVTINTDVATSSDIYLMYSEGS